MPVDVPPATDKGRLGSVFFTSVGICALFVAWGVLFTDNLSTVTTSSLNWVTGTFGWAYLVVTLALLVFLVFLAFSPAGDIRLGADHDRPEFSTMSWFAMILSAVMGIGLVSYGVAEPISHFAAPPHGLAEAGTPQAAVRALQYSYFDWGLHAWAIFAVFGLAIAYSTYRKGRRTLVSQLFYPLLGERVNGPIGKAIDVLAVFATLFGTTTSLGLGALQVNNGLGIAVGRPGQLGEPGADHRLRHRGVHHLGRDRRQQGHQVPQPGQRGPRDRPVRLHARRRPDRVPRQPLHRVPRHLRHRLLPDEPAGHRVR